MEEVLGGQAEKLRQRKSCGGRVDIGNRSLDVHQVKGRLWETVFRM